MYAEPLVLVMVLVFGCAAFLFGVFYLICWFVGGLGKGFVQLLRPRRLPNAADHGPAARGPGRVCSRDLCRNIEYRRANYCSQCGMPLTD